MTNMKASKKSGCSPMFITLLRRGDRFTTDIAIAREVAKLTGITPIEYISPRLRKTYLIAYPGLDKKPVRNKK